MTKLGRLVKTRRTFGSIEGQLGILRQISSILHREGETLWAAETAPYANPTAWEAYSPQLAAKKEKEAT